VLNFATTRISTSLSCDTIHLSDFTYAAPFPTSFLALDTAVFPVLSDIHQGKYLEDNTAAVRLI